MTKVALVGNPNSGKTTLFNQLTGLRQKTANYHGITVEASSGAFVFDHQSFEITDLPGLYNLYPTSDDGKGKF
jgi:ferrous iron transport protein B